MRVESHWEDSNILVLFERDKEDVIRIPEGYILTFSLEKTKRLIANLEMAVLHYEQTEKLCFDENGESRT